MLSGLGYWCNYLHLPYELPKTFYVSFQGGQSRYLVGPAEKSKLSLTHLAKCVK